MRNIPLLKTHTGAAPMSSASCKRKNGLFIMIESYKRNKYVNK